MKIYFYLYSYSLNLSVGLSFLKLKWLNDREKSKRVGHLISKRRGKRDIKAFFILILFLFFPAFLTAQKKEGKIWIKAPQMSVQEFKAFLQALGSPHISYAEHLLLRKGIGRDPFSLRKNCF